MPMWTVSGNNKIAKSIIDYNISPSKAFQLGVKISAAGGVGILDKLEKGEVELKKELEKRDKLILDLEKKIAKQQDELKFIRKKYVLKKSEVNYAKG